MTDTSRSPLVSARALHTPGPWCFVERGREDRTADHMSHWVCEENDPGHNVGICLVEHRDESEANARLIAAAPEMLAALEATEALDFREDCEECEGEGEPEACGLCFPKADDARLKRRAAIAKARGDSQ